MTELAKRPAGNAPSISQSHRDVTDERYRDLRRPRKVRFYCNGDRYFKGKRIYITPHRYLTFNDLLNDLTGKLPATVQLPYGVRAIYTPVAGKRVKDIEDLQDGSAYVCAGFENFKSIQYGKESIEPWTSVWSSKVPTSTRPCACYLCKNNGLEGDSNIYGSYHYPGSTFGTTPYGRGYHGAFHPGRNLRQTYPKKGYMGYSHNKPTAYGPGYGGNEAPTVSMKPKVVTVVRNGPKPRNNVKILLNRRSVQSYEQLVKDISEAFGPKWKNNKVRRLFTVRGREVQGVSDFFRDDDVFIGVGNDSLTTRDVQEILEELYPESPYARSLLKEWEKTKKKQQNRLKPDEHLKESEQSKIDSGLGSDESARDEESTEAPTNKSKDKKKKKKPYDAQDEDLVTRLEKERVKYAELERERARKRMHKRVEAEKRALEEERRKRGLVPLKPVTDPFKKMQDEREKEKQEQREREKREAQEQEKARREEEEKERQRELKAAKARAKKAAEEEPPKVIVVVKGDKEEGGQNRKKKVKEKQEVEDREEKSKSPVRKAKSPERKVKEVKEKENEEKREEKAEKKDEKVEKKEVEQNEQKEKPKAENEEQVKSARTVKVVEPEEVIEEKIEVKDSKEAKPEQEGKDGEAGKTETAENKEAKDTKDKKDDPLSEKKKKQKSKIIRKSKVERQISNLDYVMNKYEPGKVLGDGNFAIVKTSKLRGTNQEYAMKIVDKSKLKGKEHMIENEIEIMKQCNHPSIVKLMEEFETKTEIYLIMELVKGGDLFDAITQSVKFDERTASGMVSDLANALFYLHTRSIVHRDLKPENLLVLRNKDGSMSLKLADFGLAMEVKEPIFTVCGTPTYVAPEILSEIGYGLEVDMWAVGVISYILLCGFPPFRSPDRNQTELFEFIKAGEYEFLSPYWDKTSRAAKDLISRLLIVEKRKRYDAKDVLCHPWVITLGGVKAPSENIDTYRTNLKQELTKQAKANMEAHQTLKGQLAQGSKEQS